MALQYYSIQFGNFWRGAIDTKRVSVDTHRFGVLPTATAVVQVKTPTFIDVSHWEIVEDWYSIPDTVILFGTKATEGTNYKDPTFPDYFTKAKTILGVRRLAYHFFRRAYNPVTQANWFIDYISPYITDDDILCLDFEEGGEDAGQLREFLERVIQRRPNNQLMIYSRKNLMDAIAMTSSEKAFFKSIPSWVAGYPNDPNPYTTTPAGYIPDQTRWGPVWAWQYSDAGQIAGFGSQAVDVNLMEPPLIEFVGAGNNDVTLYPYEGVKQVRGERY